MTEGGLLMELSEEDLRLINALQISPRISWTDAAEVLDVHATTLASRWERLRESGAAWTTAHLMGDPKNACLPFLARDGRASAAEIARALGRHPATVQRQLGRVLASRMLSFRCEIAQQYSGYPITCQWFANVPAGQHEAAAAELRAVRNVRFTA